ncbi:MAG TPA: bifunctional 4-hydroxy-2-oxoglutarate aldolase/2-dehydro-3-deoxy-phosphogluconate aldolase [Bryobacteraceae bacterium]|nr:bifunctional 4-hydroxy-2-oxoglutarate aldolase/2-dehydro-3-deoxy-phosphogluconate aldolase [Bryobacteraceae bacterium]
MTKSQARTRIEEIGVIPGIRVSTADDALFAAEAVCSAGIPIVEVTMTIPGAVDVIRELVRQNTGMVVGAGTVLYLDTARRCLDAGAVFLTTPGLDSDIVHFAAGRDVLVFPGALTPTEVMAAWKAGADFVKIFPCFANGGPSYIKSLKLPFPDIPLIASGGVDQQNATDFILAGAVALGIGRHLIHPDAIKRRERGWVHELSRRYLGMVSQARDQLKRVVA